MSEILISPKLQAQIRDALMGIVDELKEFKNIGSLSRIQVLIDISDTFPKSPSIKVSCSRFQNQEFFIEKGEIHEVPPPSSE